jgi:hypothetical protein
MTYTSECYTYFTNAVNRWQDRHVFADCVACRGYDGTGNGFRALRGVTWKVRTNFGYEFHIPEQEKVRESVRKHLICELIYNKWSKCPPWDSVHVSTWTADSLTGIHKGSEVSPQDSNLEWSVEGMQWVLLCLSISFDRCYWGAHARTHTEPTGSQSTNVVHDVLRCILSIVEKGNLSHTRILVTMFEACIDVLSTNFICRIPFGCHCTQQLLCSNYIDTPIFLTDVQDVLRVRAGFRNII